MKKRVAAFLLLGGMIGGLFLTPAGAHITDSVRHLWRDHIKPKADNRYRLTCNFGPNLPHSGVCFEAGQLSADGWRDASLICANRGRRLPTLSELDAFRRRYSHIEIGTDEQMYELTSEYAGFAEGPGNQAYVLERDGGISTTSFAAEAPFRCVKELTHEAFTTW